MKKWNESVFHFNIVRKIANKFPFSLMCMKAPTYLITHCSFIFVLPNFGCVEHFHFFFGCEKYVTE